ncbi:FG-GAP repeat domain-containing protein [Streptomyces sp. T028]|uniref:FG-GAP repeat domain-containing protein n=1 Tax=Streptomyces sp. T028 TaxID=3394379 RepID=UPI003A837DE0
MGRFTPSAFVVAGLVFFTGCEDVLGPPPPPPDGPPSVMACVTGAGELIADLNDDGLPDRVVDPTGQGVDLTITFGFGTAHETKAGHRALADHAGTHQNYVRVAVADFDRDGWSDLVVVAGENPLGDDPIPPKLAELRFGPFSNTGRGQRIQPLDLGPTKDMKVADFNHDRYPDISAYTYAGDGVHAWEGRLGEPGRGLGTDTHEYTLDDTGQVSPQDLPATGLDPFYPRCSPDTEDTSPD